MKLIDTVKKTLFNLKSSIRRFPITLTISTTLFILLIILNELQDTLNDTAIKNFTKINMIVAMGIFLSLCIGLLIEIMPKNRIKSILLYVFGGIILILYHQFLIYDFNYVSITRYVGIIVFLLICFFFIPRIKKDCFEKYVIRIFSNFFVTFIYSLVLFLGISAIIFTLNALFELNIDEKYYYYTFLFVSTIFALALFLSKIPKNNEDLISAPYIKSLNILLNYIVIPLLTIYSFILYAYFVKILVTWQWPSGLVSHLVLWYSCISVAVLFLTTPLLGKNNMTTWFNKLFPKAVLPLLLMMFYSMGLRIQQYALTENRYFVILMGLWLTVIMLYFSFAKKYKNIFIPMTLSIVIFIAVMGPLSGYSLSKISQNNRLNSILENNNMIDEGKIIPNEDIPQKDQKEINNILSYFNTNYNLDDVKALPDNYNLEDMKDTFGFSYTPEYGYNNTEYLFYHLDTSSKPISIRGYDYFIFMSAHNYSGTTIDGISINFNTDNLDVKIADETQILFKSNIIEYVNRVHDQNKTKAESKEMIDSIETVTFKENNENVEVQFIFTNISGQINENGDLEIENAEFYFLINKK